MSHEWDLTGSPDDARNLYAKMTSSVESGAFHSQGVASDVVCNELRYPSCFIVDDEEENPFGHDLGLDCLRVTPTSSIAADGRTCCSIRMRGGP